MTFREFQSAHCAAHAESEIDCVDCTIAQQNATLTLGQKAKRFSATKRSKSAVASAQPEGRTYRHVAGDVPTRHELDTNLSNNPILAAMDKLVGQTASAPVTPLQQPLTDGAEPFVAAPAHLSEVTLAKGFILAGNAYFTVRSLKTGVRYTYRVNRAACSRCGKLDCQCWAHPTYFVALLTGPDNTGDYTYLGMLREGVFRLTRKSKLKDDSKPVLAFRWVWEALAAGRYPAQVEIWHEGRCGRCGRALTVPESIASGIGPVCAEKVNA